MNQAKLSFNQIRTPYLGFLSTFLFIIINLGTIQVMNAQTGCINGTPRWCNGSNINNTSSRNGNGVLGPTINICRTGLDFVTSSQRLGQRFSPIGIPQPAIFTVSGIPAGAIIETAYLYSGTSGNGIAVTANITNPSASTTGFPMAVIGSGSDKCWGYAGSFSYRATVTSIISGNGNYTISGLPVGGTNDTDGATLLIIYSVASATFTGCISIDDGSIVSIGTNSSDQVTFTACGTTALPGARAFGMFADLQFNNSTLTFNGNVAPYAFNWWNYIEVPTTVTNTQTIANFTASYPGDCVNWVAAGIYTRCELVVTTPTLGQWGIILFVLLLMGFSSVYVYQRQLIAQTSQGNALGSFSFDYSSIFSNLKFNTKQFFGIYALALALISALFMVAIKIFDYSLMEYDVIGSLLCGFIGAVFIHYFRNNNK
ncbi:MAG: hypothetical protein HOP11_07240 [Saprospiraceae bacterium]|nr:hypothetical protein [Saprospiraceae bacterium]